MSELASVKSANDAYAAQFTKGDLPMPPGRRFAVVTCMDARIDPAKALGLEEGDAHVIRNAGGIVTDDALRSLVISRTLLGTQEAFVIGHTDCGMLTFTNDQIRGMLRDELGAEAAHVDFQPFPDVGRPGRRERPPHPRVESRPRRLRSQGLRLRREDGEDRRGRGLTQGNPPFGQRRHLELVRRPTGALVGEEEDRGCELTRVGERVDRLTGLARPRAARCPRPRSGARRGCRARGARAQRPA